MKKLLIIFLFLSNVVYSQNLKEYYQQYLKHCDSVVDEKVNQLGSVSLKTFPVYKDDSIIAYKLLPKSDTLWKEYKCPEFKYIDVWERESYKLNIGIGPNSNSREVTRTRICKCKLEKPTSEGFYIWLYEKLSK